MFVKITEVQDSILELDKLQRLARSNKKVSTGSNNSVSLCDDCGWALYETKLF